MNIRDNDLIQAYKQAPWRRQVQFVGMFTAVIAVVLTGVGIYLYVTASAATVGREIQDLQDEKQALQHSIENYQSELAKLTSARSMVERAEALGFFQVNPSTAMYLVVPGYAGRQEINLSSPSLSGGSASQAILPEYTMTLFDWATSLLNDIAVQTGASQ